MKRIVTYHYGLFGPEHWTAEEENHLDLQVDFWNSLAEIENQLLDEQDATLRTHEMYREALEKARDIDEQLKTTYQNRRKIGSADFDETIAALKTQRDAVHKTSRVAFRNALHAKQDEINVIKTMRKTRIDECRHEYSARGLWWPNYNAVLQSYDTIGTRLKIGERLHHHDRSADARLTIKIQSKTDKKTGLIKGELFVSDFLTGKHCAKNMLRIEQLPENHPLTRRGLGRDGKVRLLIVKIADKLFGEWPIVLHRPFPSGKITQVTLSRRRWAPGDVRWWASFVIEIDTVQPISYGRACGLDIGWREGQDGSVRLVVGYDGEKHFDFVIPPSWLEKWEKIQRRKSELAHHFNEMVSALNDIDQNILPFALTNRVREFLSIEYPRSRDLSSLVNFWQKNYESSDSGGVLLKLLRWSDVTWRRYRDNGYSLIHLRNERKELFRIFAKKIAMEYDVIGVDSTNVAQLATDRTASRNSRRIRTAVAPKELVAEIERAAKVARRHFTEVAGPTTRRCSYCGCVNPPPENKAALIWECVGCGREWDRDHNSSRNIHYAVTDSCGSAPFRIRLKKTNIQVRAKLTRKGQRSKSGSQLIDSTAT